MLVRFGAPDNSSWGEFKTSPKLLSYNKKYEVAGIPVPSYPVSASRA